MAALDASGLRGSIDLVVGRAERDDRTKAELLSAALERLGPRSGAPLYTGDHPEDRAAAEGAGIAFLEYGPRSWDEIREVVLAARFEDSSPRR